MIKLTEVSGIHKLSVSDFGEKLMIPRQLSSVSRTQATIVHSGCKATCKQKIFGNEAEIFLKVSLSELSIFCGRRLLFLTSAVRRVATTKPFNLRGLNAFIHIFYAYILILIKS